MSERDFSVRTRRTTRIPLRIAARVSVRDDFGSPEMFTAWTVVVNKHGARFKCRRQFELSKEVGITSLATGKSGSGKVIWSSTHPDRDGNYEFAVALDEATNLWQITYPPQDWERVKLSANENLSESQAARELEAYQSSTEAGSEHQGSESIAAEEDESESAEQLIPGHEDAELTETAESRSESAGFPETTLQILTPSTSSMLSSDEVSMSLQNVNVSEEREAQAASELESRNVAAPSVPADPAVQAAVTSPRPAPQPESRAKGGAPTDRLTDLLKELAESAVHSNLQTESERLFQDMKRRLGKEQDAALYNLVEQSNALLGSQEAMMEARAAELKSVGDRAIADALRHISEIAEQRSRNMEQSAETAALASLENFRKRVAQELSALEEQSRQHLRSDAERLLAASLETARITFSSQFDQATEKLREREAAMFHAVEEREQRTTRKLEENAARLEAQLAESARNLIGNFAEQALTGLNKSQQEMLAQAESKIVSASIQSLAEVRNGLARTLRDVAAAMAGNPPEE